MLVNEKYGTIVIIHLVLLIRFIGPHAIPKDQTTHLKVYLGFCVFCLLHDYLRLSSDFLLGVFVRGARFVTLENTQACVLNLEYPDTR